MIKNSTTEKCAIPRSVIARLLLSGILAVMLQQVAWAQQQGENETGVTAPKNSSDEIREQVLNLIATEVVLAPGVGLQNVRLGESLINAKNRLGPPSNVSGEGLLKQTNSYLYTLDNGTAVVISGRNSVSEIRVTGTSANLVRTVQGARFGMGRDQIQRIYRTPSRAKNNRLEYKHFGITFYFEKEGVSRIDLYPRKS